MPGVKKIDIDKLEQTKAALQPLLNIAKHSKHPNTMRGVAIHLWIDGNLPKRETFEKWCREDRYPYSYSAFASIRRLFAYWGIKVSFNAGKGWSLSGPHCLSDVQGFPWKVDLSLHKDQCDWVNKVATSVVDIKRMKKPTSFEVINCEYSANDFIGGAECKHVPCSVGGRNTKTGYCSRECELKDLLAQANKHIAYVEKQYQASTGRRITRNMLDKIWIVGDE